MHSFVIKNWKNKFWKWPAQISFQLVTRMRAPFVLIHSSRSNPHMFLLKCWYNSNPLYLLYGDKVRHFYQIKGKRIKPRNVRIHSISDFPLKCLRRNRSLLAEWPTKACNENLLLTNLGFGEIQRR